MVAVKIVKIVAAVAVVVIVTLVVITDAAYVVVGVVNMYRENGTSSL